MAGPLQWAFQHGAAWGTVSVPNCAALRRYMGPESFAWAHEHGCPCDCPEGAASATTTAAAAAAAAVTGDQQVI